MTSLLVLDDGVARLTPVAGITFAVVGALLLACRPDNSVGRLLVAMGAVWAGGEAAYTYLALNPVHPEPVIDFVTWLNVWAYWPMPALATFVVALFRLAHNPKVGGSNPPPATTEKPLVTRVFAL